MRAIWKGTTIAESDDIVKLKATPISTRRVAPGTFQTKRYAHHLSMEGAGQLLRRRGRRRRER